MKSYFIPSILGAAGLIFASASHSQAQATSANSILENVKIVTGTGKVIESGYIIWRNDKLDTIGEGSTTVEAGFTHYDGKGLIAYPGLIDAYCAAGVSAPPAAPAGGGIGGGAPRTGQQGRNGGARPATPAPTPFVWRKATDGLNMNSGGLSGLRANGFTAVNLISRGPLTPGEDVIIALSMGDKPDILKERSAVNINTQTRQGGYPSTLMGAYAFLRQSFYDGIDSRNHPPAKPDPKLEALATAAEGKIPALVSTGSLNDTKRAMRLGAEFKMKAVVVGGVGSEPLAKQFGTNGTGLILTGDWDPAAALYKDGAEFALASGRIELDADDAKGMITKARELVSKSNIPADKVLAALTSVPAKLLGVFDKMGSLETGKLANIVVTSGELLKDGTIKYVFVKGKSVSTTPVKTAADQRPQRIAADGINPVTITFDDADGDGGSDK